MNNPHRELIARLARRGLWLLLVLAAVLSLARPGEAQGRGPIYTLTLDGVVSRFSVGFLERAMREAEAAGAELLIVQLSAQGAVLSEVRSAAAQVAQARVPVVVYVTPPGTRSGAAGVWLLPAAHLAAMAPNTSFGIAAPLVQPTANLSDATRELLYNETINQFTDWNRARGRSDAWVEQAVRQGLVLNNEQAVALVPPAVDVVARDLQELLVTLEGRVVVLEDGEQRTLSTLGRAPQPLAPTLWEQVLLLLATPTVAFLLLVLAAVAIYGELVTPGLGVLAGLGIVLLLAAAVGLIVLPVRWLAVLGLVIAFGLIVADLYTPSHGAFTVVGLVVLVVSALTLFDAAQAPGVGVALWAVVLVALLVAAFAAVGIYLVLRTRNRPVATGQEGLVGRLAEVRKRLDPEGFVFVEGALWRAVSEDGDVEPGELVRVTGVYELRLTVRRVTEEPGPAPRSSPDRQG
ncbi:MAG: nodulation protein NfeD [Chloroflexi bacterium]|nr:nodulation protein NfeD [Chloroflexota bacterium]